MAVIAVFGATEQGKSWFTENRMMGKYDRNFIYDHAHCFKGKSLTFRAKNDYFSTLLEYSKSKKFKALFRPTLGEEIQKQFDKFSSMVLCTGMSYGARRPENERILYTIDEADQICSSSFQSKPLKKLLNHGRHQNIDTLVIARNPNRLHTDIRTNVSKIVCFKTPNASSIPFLTDTFQKEGCEILRTIEKYHCLVWTDNGEIVRLNEKGQKVELC